MARSATICKENGVGAAVIAHASMVEHLVLLGSGVAALAVYATGWLRAPGSKPTRLLSWFGGVGALLLATSPPLERLADESFSGHMVQHLLIIVVAAPLVVIAEPVATVLATWPGLRWSSPTERRVTGWWRRAAPIVAPTSFVVVLFVTHLTGIYDLALSNRVVHDLEHLAYVGAAMALWAAVRGAGRAAAVARVGSVFAVIGGTAMLGIVLLTASAPLVPTYVEQLGDGGALDDQRVAASIMWVGGMATTLPLLLIAVWRWATTEERIAQRMESLTSSAERPAAVGRAAPDARPR